MLGKLTRTMLMAAVLAWNGAAVAQEIPADPAQDHSPWGLASGAEWAKHHPRFNPILRDAGFTWLRIFDEWGWIQPTPDQWKWDAMDAKLSSAKANNIRLSGGLWYFAPWATPTGDTRTAPLKSLDGWSKYVEAVVTRYKADIKHWEVLNEFNGSFGRVVSGASKPKVYAELVVAASKAAKSADPEARIGLNCANFDVAFFDAVIKAGAAGHFDFICIHPYENIGMMLEGEEGAFLTMAGTIRKMLADNKQPTDLPIWITEGGVLAPVKPDAEAEARQAEGIVKLYVLSMAQGIERIFWFEAIGPEYGRGVDHGLLRTDWTPRPALTAMTTMTAQLGRAPAYAGWLDQGGAYGFVFDADGAPVLVTWARRGQEASLTFSADVEVVEIMGAKRPLRAGEALKLTATPVFIANPPAELVGQAKANADRPFPWGGHYADARTVSIVLAATNIEKGITQIRPETTAVEHGLAESYRRTQAHSGKIGSEGRYAYFRVDSAFAGFGVKELEITVVAKRAKPDTKASCTLTYESLNNPAYKSTRERFEIPAGDGWHEYTWRITDANFVGGWGWHFRTDASGSPGDFYIREVRVTKP